ncbi:MAG TPA: hypothetical protein VFC78_00930 [Tepidisphaeraceae bacterium]|nr:hypothetical protein [Tepidisphaeraceae bacterium]
MILSNARSELEQSLADEPRWYQWAVRGRFLLAGIYLAIAASLFAWLAWNGILQQDSDTPVIGTLIAFAFFAGILFGMQALLLAGAPKLRRRRVGRRRMAVSIITGGLMAALLSVGFFATSVSVFRLDFAGALDRPGLHWVKEGSGVRFLLVMIGVPWLMWSILFALLWARKWVTGFGRMYKLLVAGTWLELLVTVPVDVAVRRRTRCYCGEGTFYSLIIGITMMFWTFGPGVLFLFADVRRRRREHSGLCVKCGYDLRGLPEPRCPECGRAFDPAVASSFPLSGLS